MQLPTDFRDLICAFNAEGVEYLVVGGYALGAHGMPRYTGDLDFFFRRTQENTEKIVKALRDFGYSSPELTAESLMQPGMIHYFGRPPLRVDLINEVSGVEFDDAWSERFKVQTDGPELFVISLRHLKMNKKASGRLKDLADLETIEKKGL